MPNLEETGLVVRFTTFTDTIMEKELLAHLLNNSNSGVFNLYDANFYVMNSERNVYKCLDNNNNDYGGSTVELSGTDTIVLSTVDGYKWKYICTLFRF